MSNIKAVVESSGETCDFYLPQTATMEDLVNTLMAMLEIEPGFKLKYRDEEGDAVTMSTTQELRDVIRGMPNLKLELSNCKKSVRASSSVGVQAKAETATAATDAQHISLSDFEVKRLLLHLSLMSAYLGLEVPETLRDSPRDEARALIEEASVLYGRLLATVRVESHATSHIARGITSSLARHGAALPQDFASSLDAALSAAVTSASRTSTDDSSHHFRSHETESTVLIDPKVTFQPVLPTTPAAPSQSEAPAQEEEHGHSSTNARLEVEVQSDDFVLVSNSTEDVHHQQQQQPAVPAVDARVVSEFDPLSTAPAASSAPVVPVPVSVPVPAASSSNLGPFSATTTIPTEPVVAPSAIKQDLQMIDIPDIEYPTVPVPVPDPAPANSYNPFFNAAPAVIPAPVAQPQPHSQPYWPQDGYVHPPRTSLPPQDYTSPPRSEVYPPAPSGSYAAPTPFDYPPPATTMPTFQPPAQPSPASQAATAEKWAAQLIELNNMGFVDNEKNISALESFNGAMETVVASLVSDM